MLLIWGDLSALVFCSDVGDSFRGIRDVLTVDDLCWTCCVCFGCDVSFGCCVGDVCG